MSIDGQNCFGEQLNSCLHACNLVHGDIMYNNTILCVCIGALVYIYNIIYVYIKSSLF